MKPNVKRILKDVAVTFAVSLAMTFLVVAVLAMAVPFEKENVPTVNVYDNTIRLRVVANSDSDYDQDLKLKVRNDIIETAHEIFKDSDNIEKAKLSAKNNMELLKVAAENSVKKYGADYDVSVRLLKEDCPVRRYSDFTFPAGEYLTLRVDIGKAQGKNWWCVMYPPLCVTAATNDVYVDKRTFADHGFTEKQVEELMEKDTKPVYKLAVVEFFKNIFN